MGNYHKGVYVFDVDGTLTDTGPAHICFCNDLNIEKNFGLPIIDINNPEAVRNILGTPMNQLLRNYGFPEINLEKLDEIYGERFSFNEKYKSNPFPGTKEMLERIQKEGRLMVLLTSNTSQNVKRDLGNELWNIFDRHIDKEELTKHHQNDKGQALNFLNYAECDQIPTRGFVCVGDTEKDYLAAKISGCRFIGVSYGWEITKDDKRFPVVNNPKELEEYLLSAF